MGLAGALLRGRAGVGAPCVSSLLWEGELERAVAQTEREFWREFACGQRWAPKPAPGSRYTLFITSQSRFP